MKPYLIAIVAATGLAVCACTGGSPSGSPTQTVTITAQPSAPASTGPATTAPAVSPSAPAAAAGCLTRYLNGATGLSQGTAGTVYVVLTFKNLNNVPCTLYGFPGVTQQAGKPLHQVGQPSAEDTSTARELITLAPGGFAYATLAIEDAGALSAAQCTPKTVHWLAVIPPNETVPLYVSYTSTACQGTGKILKVTAVRAGNGG